MRLAARSSLRSKLLYRLTIGTEQFRWRDLLPRRSKTLTDRRKMLTGRRSAITIARTRVGCLLRESGRDVFTLAT